MSEAPFVVGQPVLCVRVDGGPGPSPPLRLWGIYHVASVRYLGPTEVENPGWGITVEELPVVETSEYAAEYEATRFRPIEPDSLPTAHHREEEPA